MAGSWTSGAPSASDAARVWFAGSSSQATRTSSAASSAASDVSAATAATGSPWYFVSPTARTGRSRRCGPKRGIGCGRSAAVITSRTPGTSKAARASISPIRARAASTVTSFTWRTSSRSRSATYSCCPVTRPMPPTLAGDVPTLPVIAVQRRRSGSMPDPPSPAPGCARRGPAGRRSPRPRPPRTPPR